LQFKSWANLQRFGQPCDFPLTGPALLRFMPLRVVSLLPDFGVRHASLIS
jgi:hypothetical protein